MSHYGAILEEAGPDRAVGIWFPDLPGCFSAGDTIDEAVRNAPEAIALYAEALTRAQRSLPPPRLLSDLKKDRSFVEDVRGNLVALIPFRELIPSAAE